MSEQRTADASDADILQAAALLRAGRGVDAVMLLSTRLLDAKRQLAQAELAARTNAEGWKEALRWAGELQERTVRSLR